MANTIDVLLGQAPEVYQLFSYANHSLALTDVISHGFNQTLQRDKLWGSWADAYVHDNGQYCEYHVKITSPTDDLSCYVDRIEGYLAAGRMGLQAYNQKVRPSAGFSFLLPFGLAMANIRSVQLLHFPPSETLLCLDYLYSPTNRRWECLLVQNGFDGQDCPSVERIVDVVPIAAQGGAGKEIEPYNDAFFEYGQAQLQNFLDEENGFTQPVVAYGGPVRDWLWKVYEEQIKAQLGSTSSRNPLDVLSLVELEILRGAKTTVLCANHPSKYLFDLDDMDARVPEQSAPKEDELLTVMRQDLIAAGWQAAMSSSWSVSASDTLDKMNERWAEDEKVEEIMREHRTEFSYGK